VNAALRILIDFEIPSPKDRTSLHTHQARVLYHGVIIKSGPTRVLDLVALLTLWLVLDLLPAFGGSNLALLRRAGFGAFLTTDGDVLLLARGSGLLGRGGGSRVGRLGLETG
jgi:hypothetical protein